MHCKKLIVKMILIMEETSIFEKGLYTNKAFRDKQIAVAKYESIDGYQRGLILIAYTFF